MTLSKYIKLYIEEIFSGARQTDKGSNFAYGTAKSLRECRCLLLYLNMKKDVKLYTLFTLHFTICPQ